MKTRLVELLDQDGFDNLLVLGTFTRKADWFCKWRGKYCINDLEYWLWKTIHDS